MKNLRYVVQVFILGALALGTVACDKKKDSQPNFRDRFQRGPVDTRGNGPIRPGGDPYYDQNCPGCGYIYNSQSSFNNVLEDFLGLEAGDRDTLGYVSGQLYDYTGVILRGDIDSDGRRGYMDIFIWDDEADRTGEAYQVALEVVGGRVDNSGADIELRDDYGYVCLSGDFRNGLYEGRVTYSNSSNCNSSGRTLGSFIVGECDLVRCN